MNRSLCYQCKEHKTIKYKIITLESEIRICSEDCLKNYVDNEYELNDRIENVLKNREKLKKRALKVLTD